MTGTASRTRFRNIWWNSARLRYCDHFHEITALADDMNGKVVNKHFSAITDNDTVTMMYALKDGPCEQSYGIQVAKMAGFPPIVVDVASAR